MNSVMLDTSFCIRLLKSDDEYHQNAVDYFQFFLENKIIINISTIVIAEYSVKDDPNHLPLRKMRIVPFDFEDAKTAGEYHNIIKQDKLDLSGLGINRQLIKDDCNILSQITNRKIEGYITKDKKSFSTIINPILKHSGHVLKLIDLSINFSTYKKELPFPTN